MTTSHPIYEAPHYYHPQPDDPPAVFLAGGITGVERWHHRAITTLHTADPDLIILNPNRTNFPINNPDAGWEQVTWEQHHLHLANVLTLFWFPASDPTVTTQPIAMFELGQALGEQRRIVVGAHPDYPRYADVRMLTRINRHGARICSDLDELLQAVIYECGIYRRVRAFCQLQPGMGQPLTTSHDHIPDFKDLPEGCRCIWTSKTGLSGWFREATHQACPIHGEATEQNWTVSDLPGGDHDGVSRSTTVSETL